MTHVSILSAKILVLEKLESVTFFFPFFPDVLGQWLLNGQENDIRLVG